MSYLCVQTFCWLLGDVVDPLWRDGQPSSGPRNKWLDLSLQTKGWHYADVFSLEQFPSRSIYLDCSFYESTGLSIADKKMRWGVSINNVRRHSTTDYTCCLDLDCSEIYCWVEKVKWNFQKLTLVAHSLKMWVRIPYPRCKASKIARVLGGLSALLSSKVLPRDNCFQWIHAELCLLPFEWAFLVDKSLLPLFLHCFTNIF